MVILGNSRIFCFPFAFVLWRLAFGLLRFFFFFLTSKFFCALCVRFSKIPSRRTGFGELRRSLNPGSTDRDISIFPLCDVLEASSKTKFDIEFCTYGRRGRSTLIVAGPMGPKFVFSILKCSYPNNGVYTVAPYNP